MSDQIPPRLPRAEPHLADAMHGHWVASVTPLTADGRIDEPCLAAHAASLIGRGCDGVLLFGTSGEGPSFSAAERLSAIETLLRSGIAPARISVGIGMPAIPDAIALGRAILALGVAHALALPPYFFCDVTADGIADAFSALVDGVDDARLRLTLYNIPQVSGIAVPPAAAATLRERHGVLVSGIKDSSGQFDSVLAYRHAAPALAILVGSEVDIARNLAAGGTGGICGLSNIAPTAVQAMFAGPAAEQTMRNIASLITGPFVPALKAIMAAQRANEAWRRVRAPLTEATAQYGADAFAAMRNLSPDDASQRS